jgi:hypothetical protein
MKAREPTSLPSSRFVRGFPAFFHDCRDSQPFGKQPKGSVMLATRTRLLATDYKTVVAFGQLLALSGKNLML